MNTEYSENELNRENLAEFADLLAGLEPLEYEHHPSEEILRAYIAHRLPEGAGRVGTSFRDEQAFEQFVRGNLSTRSDVSMHVLTCTLCQRHVERLRASRWQWLDLARQRPREEPSWPRRLALGALASAAAAAIIAVIWLWPASPPTPPYNSPTIGSVMMVYRPSPGRF
jgi:hypothetical protein